MCYWQKCIFNKIGDLIGLPRAPNMDSFAVKEESLGGCRICFCTDKRLTDLGIYTNTLADLLKILSTCKINCGTLQNLQICWECRAKLRNISKFQELIYHAQKSFNSSIKMKNELTTQKSPCLKTKVITDYDFEFSFEEESHKKEVVIELKAEPLEENIEDHELEAEPFYDPESDEEDLYKSKEYFETKPSEVPCVDLEILPHEIKQEIELSPENFSKRRKKGPVKVIKYRRVKADDSNVKAIKKLKINMEEFHKMREEYKKSPIYMKKQHKCTKCVHVFPSKKLLVHHNKTRHNASNKFICDLCGVRVANLKCMVHHLRRHFTCYQCTVCGIRKHVKSNIYQHYRKIHRWKWECLECQARFDGRINFFRHYKECHQKFMCEVCEIIFEDKEKLAKHQRQKHTPLECSICKIAFKKRDKMIDHNRLKHSKAENKETCYCVECDIQFENEYRYKNHLRTSVKHNKKEKIRHPCPECGKLFTKKHYVSYHYNLVHLKKTKHYCEQCDKYFARPEGLRRHIAGVHLGVRPPKNIFCDICGRGFQTKRILDNHRRTHTGEKPFACDYCDATFTQKCPRDNHVKHIHLKMRRAAKPAPAPAHPYQHAPAAATQPFPPAHQSQPC